MGMNRENATAETAAAAMLATTEETPWTIFAVLAWPGWRAEVEADDLCMPHMVVVKVTESSMGEDERGRPVRKTTETEWTFMRTETAELLAALGLAADAAMVIGTEDLSGW